MRACDAGRGAARGASDRPCPPQPAAGRYHLLSCTRFLPVAAVQAKVGFVEQPAGADGEKMLVVVGTPDAQKLEASLAALGTL